MIWKILIVVSIVAIAVGGYVWVSQGSHVLTKDHERVVTVVKDDIFGTTQEVVEWVPKFTYGFFPDDTSVTTIHRGYSFVLGCSLALIGVSTFMLRRTRRTL